MTINYSRLPEHMRDATRQWIERGALPGDFLTAFISNDLFGALGRADDVNRECLIDWARFFYNDAPSQCYGSPEKVREWAKRGGLLGREPDPLDVMDARERIAEYREATQKW